MKKVLYLIFAIVTTFAYTALHSQDKLPEFGKPDLAELQLLRCPFDGNASAMNLVKTENAHISFDSLSQTAKTVAEYRVRIKIFDETGFKYANIILPYSAESHTVKITNISAYIYTLDEAGKIVVQKLDKSQIFKEKTNIRKGVTSVSFTFPGLKSGAVIEYRYTRVDKNALYLPPWLFQDDLPTRFNKITVTVPLRMRLQCRVIGNLPFEKDSVIMHYDKGKGQPLFDETMRSFTVHNVLVFRMEPFTSSFKDNLLRVEFDIDANGNMLLPLAATQDQWTIMCNGLLDDAFFGKQYNVAVDNTEAFLASLKGLKKETVIATAYTFVKRTVEWNGEHNFHPVNIVECWRDRKGSSAEMNILLLNLLHKAGIRCNAILVSTRDNGRADPNYPSLGQFNSVDVMAFDDKRSYILDCTQTNLFYQTTPFDVLNRNALLLDKQYNQWITLADEKQSMVTNLSVNATINNDGVITGASQITYTGIAKAKAIQPRSTNGLNNDDILYGRFMGSNNGDIKIDSITMQHEYDDGDTLARTLAFHYSLANTADIYFFNPFTLSMFNDNPFNDTARFSDIDFGSSQTYKTNTLITVPQNFTIEGTPETKQIRLADTSMVFNREIFVSPTNQLLIRNTFTINRALFGKEEYSDIKAFFDKMYTMLNEQVLLKRK